MGKGRAAGRVGSDFLSAIAGRVGSGHRFAGSGRVQEKLPVDNSAMLLCGAYGFQFCGIYDSWG